jgi:hypothetical protein
MKRYILFMFDNRYYPEGGWEDFRGSYETLEEARNVWYQLRADNYQIVDSKTMKMIECNGKTVESPS